MLGYRARSSERLRAMSLATEGFSARVSFVIIGERMLTRTLSVGDVG